MLEYITQLPQEIQIILLISSIVGFIVLYRFRYIVLAVGAGAVALYVSIKNRSKNKDNT